MVARIVYGKVKERPGDASTSTEAGSDDDDGIVFLNSVTATNSSVLSSGSFASVASDYQMIYACVRGLRAATLCLVGIRTSSDGTNYSATTAAYSHAGVINTATQSTLQTNPASATDLIQITKNSAAQFFATTVGGAMYSEIFLTNLNPTSTTHFPLVVAHSTWQAPNDVCGSNMTGTRKEAIAQGGIQLVNIGGGNFIDGRMDVFGLKRV